MMSLVSMGKQGLEGMKQIIDLLISLNAEVRRTNTALVALLAHTERTNVLLAESKRKSMIVTNYIKEPDS